MPNTIRHYFKALQPSAAMSSKSRTDKESPDESDLLAANAMATQARIKGFFKDTDNKDQERDDLTGGDPANKVQENEAPGLKASNDENQENQEHLDADDSSPEHSDENEPSSEDSDAESSVSDYTPSDDDSIKQPAPRKASKPKVIPSTAAPRPRARPVEYRGWETPTKKPIATQERVQRPEPTVEAASTSRKRTRKSTPARSVKRVRRSGQPKPRSMIATLAAQTAAAVSRDPKLGAVLAKLGEGVLQRPTRYTKKLADKMKSDGSFVELVPRTGKCLLFKLPEEVLNMIYELVVVDTSRIIWPEGEFAREQPDLAMVCRRMRGPVLNAYYGQNVFGFECAASEERAKRTLRKGEYGSGIAAAMAWATELGSNENEHGKWLHTIHKWVFSYEDIDWSALSKKGGGPAGEFFMVSVRFNAAVRVIDIDNENDADGNAQQSVSLPEVQIHQDAHCLPLLESHTLCSLKELPEDLDFAIKEMVKKEDGSFCGHIRHEKVQHFMMMLRMHSRDVNERTCSPV